MKILGIGVDIVENYRIAKSLRNNLFIKRIFSNSEILIAKSIKDKKSYYSKRFAAKEAFTKSIGTGFRNDINFKDISIINDKLGKPSFVINDKIKKIVKKQFKTSSFNFFLSISDEKKYSVAYVILQKK
jgi:holo-[acyl-carrier protein] synthase